MPALLYRFGVKTRLLFTFYRSYFPAALAVTLACFFFAAGSGSDLLVELAVCLKLVTTFLFLYLVSSLHPYRYYYYKNRGISKWPLWLGSAAVDWLIFIVLMCLKGWMI